MVRSKRTDSKTKMRRTVALRNGSQKELRRNRNPIRRSSEVRYAPARWDTTGAGSAVTLKRASVSYVRADREVLYSVHKKLIIPLTSRITLTLSLTKQALFPNTFHLTQRSSKELTKVQKVIRQIYIR